MDTSTPILSKPQISERNIEITNKIEVYSDRLEILKSQRFLTERIFRKISENMHYEIFKYLNSKELLQIRSTKLGGFQLVSNKILRSRIKNYFDKLYFRLYDQEDLNIEKEDQRAKLIFEQSGCQVLDFGKVKIGERQVRGFVGLLKENKSILKGINIGAGKIVGQTLINYLKYVPNLELIDMNYSEIGIAEIKRFSVNLKLIPNLKHLNLSGIGIKLIGVQALAKNLKYIPGLELLNLGANRIQDSGIKLLSQHFQFISDLRILKLRCNGIGPVGIKEFAANIKYIPKLLKLNLINNQIGNSGVHILTQYFHSLPKLNTLIISNNWIGENVFKLIQIGFPNIQII